ncbi:MAG: carbohydrate ABC transporter permease, partial [Erysipelotrichaceae bacterium]
FIGLDNYRYMFADETLHKAIKNTFTFAAIVVPTQIFISLILANILEKKLKFTSLFRVIFFLPMVAATTSVMLLFMYVFGVQGPFNDFLINIGVVDFPIDFFQNTKYSIYFIAITSIWQSIPFSTIVFLAAFSDVDKSLYEAADLDGATGIKKFVKITLPEILPTVIFIFVISVVGSLQLFDQSYIVDAPDYSSASIASMIYQYAFDPSFNSMGYAAAVSVIFGFVILVISVIIRRFDRKD